MRRLPILVILLAACSPAQHDKPASKPAATSRPMNHLANETSPYLLQHVHNPVDWYPWGEEALALAKKLGKPIFLSIGYSACHWCHVMEHESFENPAIAKQLNDNFVCIKVDREERPDLDEIYMAAVQALTGAGGWPMSVFMTPDLKPFFGGTYWPPEDRRGMPGFPRVVDHVLKLWREKRDEVDDMSKRLLDYINEQLAPKSEPNDPQLEFTVKFLEQSRERYDSHKGGFAYPPRYAPKFPHASELSQLLRIHARTGDAAVLEMAETTLLSMAEGGMYDQVGGGFHRYSTDRDWLVPHFEKMLYDNALLVPAYCDAFAVTGKPFYERVVRETLDYLLREMRDPGGAFWSTTDADSEGVEGKFFVWSRAEIDEVCGADAAIVRERFGVTDAGNWEGHNVLHISSSLRSVATKLSREPDDVIAAIDRAKQALYAARQKRVAPGTDDKVLVTWNGMAIRAFTRGYQLFGDERYLVGARSAAEFLLRDMRVDGRLLRTSRNGKAHLDAYLEDYAFLALGLLDLFESDFDPKWLREAKRLLASIERHFLDPADGSFFFTADDHEELITRSKSVLESSTPSGIATATLAFLRAGLLLGDEELYGRGFTALRANHKLLSERPIACPSLFAALELALGDPREVVIAADSLEEPAVRQFLATAWKAFPRNHVVAVVHSGNESELGKVTPIVSGKASIEGAAAAFVCRRGTCEAPVTDPTALTLR